METMTAPRSAALREVERQKQHLKQELHALEVAENTLRNGAGGARGAGGGTRATRATMTRSTRRMTRTASRPKRTRTNGRVSDDRLLAAITQTGGMSAKQLAKTCRISEHTALRRLKTLQTSGLVKREGQRAQTRWKPAGRVAA